MINDRDLSELDALESLVISDGWRLVVERITAMLDTARNGLETQSIEYRGSNSIEGLQGQARALRTVLNIPAILKAEYEAEAKQK